MVVLPAQSATTVRAGQLTQQRGSGLHVDKA